MWCMRYIGGSENVVHKIIATSQCLSNFESMRIEKQEKSELPNL